MIEEKDKLINLKAQDKPCSLCGKEVRYKAKNGRRTSWCYNCMIEHNKKQYIKHREEKLIRTKLYETKNKEKVRESRRRTQWKIKLHIINHYGGKCTCCGETEIKFLSIDHINNDGYMRRKEESTGTSSFYYWIKRNNYPNYLQVLCFNCNMAKSFFKICPHKEKKHDNPIIGNV